MTLITNEMVNENGVILIKWNLIKEKERGGFTKGS
jgi:hypothetical protein